MLKNRIIPCLDVRDGRVVKGVQFQNLRDAGDPVELAVAYEAQGADELVLLDVSATAEGRRAQCETIRRVRRELGIALTVGGGIRTVDDVRWLLEAGADKVSINTAAVDEPERIALMAEQFGVQCTVLAIDAQLNEAKTGWTVLTHAGTITANLDVLQWAVEAVGLGAGEILLTSWDRDGTQSGYDLELLRSVRSAVNVPIIASGGASNADDLQQAFEAGADAVLAASIFHDRHFTVNDLKAQLASANVEVRT